MFFFKDKKNYGQNFLILGILVWWSGLGGLDLYAVPVLIGVLFLIFQIINNNDFQRTFFGQNLELIRLEKKTLLTLLFLHGVVMSLTSVFKLYSFQWNIWDVGIYSDILFNIANGSFYSSYYLAHNWGDHFSLIGKGF